MWSIYLVHQGNKEPELVRDTFTRRGAKWVIWTLERRVVRPYEKRTGLMFPGYYKIVRF